MSLPSRPAAAHERARAQLDAALGDMVAVARLRRQDPVTWLEYALAEDHGSVAAVALGSLESAFMLAYEAAGVGSGDEVIVPALASPAAVRAAVPCGARVLLADVEPESAALHVRSVERCLSRRTRAIVAASMFGREAALAPLVALIEQRPIRIIEHTPAWPAAPRAIEASGPRPLLSCAALFGRDPSGAWQGAGAIFTADLGLARRLRQLRDDVRIPRAVGPDECTPRLDPLQASALVIEVSRADCGRRRIGDVIDSLRNAFGAAPATVYPLVTESAGPCAAVAVRCADPDGLQAAIAQRDLPVETHPLVPLHRLTEATGQNCLSGPLPGAERWARETLIVAVSPQIEVTQVKQLADCVRPFQTRALPAPPKASVKKPRRNPRRRDDA